jgi:hypothetical protein
LIGGTLGHDDELSKPATPNQFGKRWTDAKRKSYLSWGKKTTRRSTWLRRVNAGVIGRVPFWEPAHGHIMTIHRKR